MLELEAGSMVWTIKYLRPYVSGISFVIVGDHRALVRLAKVG